MVEVFEEYYDQNGDSETGTSYVDYTVYTDYTDHM